MLTEASNEADARLAVFIFGIVIITTAATSQSVWNSKWSLGNAAWSDISPANKYPKGKLIIFSNLLSTLLVRGLAKEAPM